MDVENRLAGALPVVRHEPEVGEPPVFRDRRGSRRDRSDQGLIARGDVREPGNVPLRNDEDVGRSLRSDVLERVDALVLVDLLRRDFSGGDPAEEAVVHVGLPLTRFTEAPRAFSFSSMRA